jgi:hypothetical protein
MPGKGADNMKSQSPGGAGHHHGVSTQQLHAPQYCGIYGPTAILS